MSSNLLDPTLLQALRDLQSSKYMNFAASTMWIYDFLLGISDEVRIFSSRSLKLPDVIYICSRILVFCHVFVGAASESKWRLLELLEIPANRKPQSFQRIRVFLDV
ncbi:hypothetical protein QCA50_014890 [Cerrena zonata]|uniref:DUF6533 domain-containing protein n=1 Tax=Cerrena zonata TaxID=2478898 RepID=A0AAW0FL91_9APHY